MLVMEVRDHKRSHPLRRAALARWPAWIRQTVTQLQIPRLREFGLQPRDFGDIAASAMRASSTQGNPVTLTEHDLHAILTEAA